MTWPATNDAATRLPVIVIGSGGHAKVLIDLLHLLDRTILFLTDLSEARHGQSLDGIEIRGHDEVILQHDPSAVRLVNAIGSISVPLARREVYNRFRSLGYHFETLVHPTATLADSVKLHEGVQIMAGAIVQAGAQIGENALINTAASVDHDCEIAPHVHIAPGVTLSGQVWVGEAAHIGTGATVIQGVKIGRESLVGAGAVVVRDVPDGQKVRGIPAKPAADQQAHDVSTMAAGQPFTIMLAAAGRRVALLKLIRQSLEQLGLQPRVLATDITFTSATMHCGDAARILPPYNDPNCLEQMLRLCQEFRVRLIIPTIDPDLAFLAAHRDRFEDIGTQVMVCPLEAVEICNDKKRTHEWLVSKGFPVLRQTDARQLLNGAEGWRFPVFVKPRFGSSSVGARAVASVDELRLAIASGEYIAQDVARGREYTVDVYVDRAGKCRCAVPRLRIETRGGEVTKAMTVRHQPIEELATRVAEALPGAVGAMNIQVFHDASTGELVISEINPRFGGGYPLTHQAGATMTKWVIQELLGQTPAIEPAQWTDGLVMLRYDEAVFVTDVQADLPDPVAYSVEPPATHSEIHQVAAEKDRV